jgi:hypothetical protein
MMKQFCSLFITLFFISCSSDNESSIISEEEPETNVLEILYLGHWEVVDGVGYKKDFFYSIEIEPRTEQTSPTESAEVIYIKAINTVNGDKIHIGVIKGATGTQALFNNAFNFRHLNAGYIQSDFTFNVLVNSETQFSAEFSGKLEHLYFPTQEMRYMEVSYGKINFEY